MLETLRSPWFIGGMAGAIKLILKAFNIELADQTVDDILNGVAGIATVIGVYVSHRKLNVPAPAEQIAPEK